MLSSPSFDFADSRILQVRGLVSMVCLCVCVWEGVHHCLFLRGLHADLLCAIDTGRATPH